MKTMKTIAALILALFVAMPWFVPSASGATVTVGTGFTLAWDYPNLAGNQITGYTVYEQTPSGPLVAERSGAGVLRVRITPRPVGAHTYVVTATSVGGIESAPSQPEVIQVVPLAPSVPGQVQGLTGVLANGNLTLTWSARPVAESVIHYTVTETRPGVPNTISTVNGLTMISLNVSPGIHNYQVTAVNAAGSGAISENYTVNVVPPPQNVPVSPVNLRYEAR